MLFVQPSSLPTSSTTAIHLARLRITSDPATYGGRWAAYRVSIDDLAAAIMEA
jgi:hypothetical protein